MASSDLHNVDAPNLPDLHPDARPSLWSLALAFLKIGSVGFGGWMAMIALMEQEYVRKRRYIEATEFLHGVGLSQLVGSFSVNTAMFIGYRLCGIAGLFVAFAAFLAPSVALILGLSWVYFTYHTIPALQGALTGIGPVIIALVLQAAVSMGQKGIRSWIGGILAAISCVLNVLYVNPVLILVSAGVVGVVLKMGRTVDKEKGRQADKEKRRQGDTETGRTADTERGRLGDKEIEAEEEGAGGKKLHSVVAPCLLFSMSPCLPSAGLAAIGWTFLKIGCVFFGGGFVLVPLMQRYMVNNLHWLTNREFLDGVAMSQITPGPIAILSTFSGYRMAGIPGGLVATMGLYIPSIVLMLFLSHYYKQLRHLYTVQDFLGGVVPAVVGLVVAAVIILAPGNIHLHKPIGLLLAGLAFWLFLRKWHPAYVLGIGAAAGILAPGWFM